MVCQAYKDSPILLINHAWYIALFFAVADFIVSIAVAARNDIATSGSKGAGFAAVWSMLLVIVLSGGGTMVIRKYQTPLSVGMFLGVTVMMSQMMLSLFAVFVGLAYDGGSEVPSDRAMAAFSFFLFIIYGVFAFILARNRSEVIRDPKEEQVNDQVVKPSVQGVPV